jgi:hypothetical protein
MNCQFFRPMAIRRTSRSLTFLSIRCMAGIGLFAAIPIKEHRLRIVVSSVRITC